MSIPYYLNTLSPGLLFILIVGFFASFAGICTFLFRKHIKLKILKSHNEVTGFLFIAISNFYALFLSFMVFVSLDQLMETKTNLSHESSSALSLYRDIKVYPDSIESKELMVVYLDFISNVVNEELPNMELMKPSPKTGESFNRVFYKMERLKPKSDFHIQLISGMYTHLNALATYQGLRNGALEAEIPGPTWYGLILGALVSILCSLFLHIERKQMQIFLNALMGAFIGIFFFTIIILDHPFSNILRGSPKSYEEIFNLEKRTYEFQALKKSLEAK